MTVLLLLAGGLVAALLIALFVRSRRRAASNPSLPTPPPAGEAPRGSLRTRGTRRPDMGRPRRREVLGPQGPGGGRGVRRAWRGAQARFFESPAEGVREADLLAADLVRSLGHHPEELASGRDTRWAGDPAALNSYRAAHAIAARASAGQATEDELRRAMAEFTEFFEAAAPGGGRTRRRGGRRRGSGARW